MRRGKNHRRVSLEPLERRRLLALTGLGEFPVNSTTAGDQFAPAVAADRDGAFVAVWVSDGQDGSGLGIFARRYSPAGVPLGAEFQVNTITAGTQALPAVAMDPDGDFVVAWASENVPGGSGLDVVARRFSSTGAALDAAEFRVNQYTASNQEAPSVAMSQSGSFVIAWDSNGQDGSGYEVYARLYTAAGAAVGNEFRVNETIAGLQADPSVAMERNGDFVIAWTSGSQTAATRYDIYARRYSVAGASLGGEFQVNVTVTSDYQTFPSVAMDADGDFVVAFNSYSAGGKYDVYARRYNSSGAALGNDFRVNTFIAGQQSGAAVAMDARGDFVVSWSSESQDGSGRGIYAQAYDWTGAADGPEFRANVFTANNQTRPAIALDASGDAIIVWQDGSPVVGVEGQDGSGYGIYAQRFAAPDQLAPTVASAQFNFLSQQSVSLAFSEPVLVNLVEGDITIQNTTTSQFISAGQMSIANVAGDVTIAFPGLPGGILPNGNYSVSITAGVTDLAGNALDGDDNGAPGGDHIFTFFVLAGDANRDRTVDATDLAILSANWQQSGRDFATADFSYDGRVDIADLTILINNWQISLPAAAPVPATITPARTAASQLRAARKS